MKTAFKKSLGRAPNDKMKSGAGVNDNIVFLKSVIGEKSEKRGLNVE